MVFFFFREQVTLLTKWVYVRFSEEFVFRNAELVSMISLSKLKRLFQRKLEGSKVSFDTELK